MGSIEKGGLIVETFPVGSLFCNCSILADPVSKEAVVIDPGSDGAGILRRFEARGLRVRSVLHTHAHVDHFGASALVKERTGAPLLLHERDRWLYDRLRMQAQWAGIDGSDPAPPDGYLAQGDAVSFGAFRLDVFHTPGHSPGSLCFYLDGEELLFSGDTLFAGSIGRTDLWGGSTGEILQSIREKLLKPLPPGTRVIPGHGPETTIQTERASNPFVGEGAGFF